MGSHPKDVTLKNMAQSLHIPVLSLGVIMVTPLGLVQKLPGENFQFHARMILENWYNQK